MPWRGLDPLNTGCTYKVLYTYKYTLTMLGLFLWITKLTL